MPYSSFRLARNLSGLTLKEASEKLPFKIEAQTLGRIEKYPDRASIEQVKGMLELYDERGSQIIAQELSDSFFAICHK